MYIQHEISLYLYNENFILDFNNKECVPFFSRNVRFRFNLTLKLKDHYYLRFPS